MRVFCDVTSCKYCLGAECSRLVIDIDMEGECNNYEAYDEDIAYKVKYWVACCNKGKPYRELRQGKKIEVNGVEFFTESDTRNNEINIHLTDKRTGYSVGNLKMLKDRWDIYLEKMKKIPDVMTLPIKEA